MPFGLMMSKNAIWTAKMPFGLMMSSLDDPRIWHAYSNDMSYLGALYTDQFSKDTIHRVEHLLKYKYMVMFMRVFLQM
jgi:hypothetical protein